MTLRAFGRDRRLAGEFLGTLLLLATVVGSGIMGERLSGGNAALALLANSGATGAMLYVLILIFGPVSGAHFNPAVTLVFWLRRDIEAKLAGAYIAAQVAGALAGVVAAHAMFDLPIVQISTTVRAGASQWFAEFVAAFGLIATILGASRWRPQTVPAAVGLYIAAGYWFTASTSFANPAVTIAREFTDTFSGIVPGNVPPFIVAQCTGALAAVTIFSWLLAPGSLPAGTAAAEIETAEIETVEPEAAE